MHVGIIFPDIPNWPKMRWVDEALRSLGHEVSRARNAGGFAELSRTCEVVILGQKGISGRWPDLREAFPKRKAVVCQWWGDLIAFHKAPLAKQELLSPDNHLPLMKACDFVFVKERSLLAEYYALGINAYYLDQGVPVDQAEVVRSESPKWDVLLWGQGGNAYPERVADAVALQRAGLRVAWATDSVATPPGIERLPWCHPDKLHDLAGQASCVLSCDKVHSLDGYWSDRLWMALGMGCCVLRRFTPGLPDGPYVVYRDHHELVSRTKELLTARSGAPTDTPSWSPGVLRFGKEARTWSLENHSLAHRCRQLLEVVASTAAARVA